MRAFFASVGLAVVLSGVVCGCGMTVKHSVSKPIQIEPIHITVDVNVRVQKELNEFFKDIDDAE